VISLNWLSNTTSCELRTSIYSASQNVDLKGPNYNLSYFLSVFPGKTTVISKLSLHSFHQQLFVWFTNSLSQWQYLALALWLKEYWFFYCKEASVCVWNHFYEWQQQTTWNSSSKEFQNSSKQHGIHLQKNFKRVKNVRNWVTHLYSRIHIGSQSGGCVLGNKSTLS
jgi:hypothetical protein